MRILIKSLSPLFMTLLLSQCASYDFSKRVVQQGNLLPKEKVEKLHVGMDKQEVAALMGTSLLSPTFNNNRWDYAYTYRKGSGSNTTRRLSVYFADDRIQHLETNVL